MCCSPTMFIFNIKKPKKSNISGDVPVQINECLTCSLIQVRNYYYNYHLHLLFAAMTTVHAPILRWGAPWRTGTTAAPTAGRAPPSGSPEPSHT